MILVAAAWSMTAGCMDNPNPAALATAEEDSSIVDSNALRWPNTIKYLIDDDGQYLGKLDAHCQGDDTIEGAAWQALPAGDADAIRAALAEYSEVTPIKFEEIDPGEEPNGPFLIYTRWKTSGSSHASTGGFPSDGKAACVYLAHDKAIGVGTILHETGHELGTPHEQRRADARNFVIFDDRCVDTTQPWDPITTGLENLAPYDFDSIMEYASTSGCDETLPGCDDGTGHCAHPPLVKKISGCTAGSTAAACQIPHSHDLSVSDVNVLHRAYEQRLGSNEAGDHFASALAVGDFDGDGFQDLAVGAYGEDVPGTPGGAVFLYKGTSSASAGTLGRLVAWKRLDPPNGGLYAHFGEALAVGDFDGDGVDDLAVSAPGAVGGNELFGGGLFIYSAIELNRPDGTTSRKLAVAQTQWWTELSLHTGLQSGDRFGASLAAGDFDGDGVDDLAVGIPHRTIDGVESGAVQILLGHKHGVLSVGQELNAAMLAGETLHGGARFGAAVLAQNFDPEIGPRADLIVGAPGSSSSGTGSAFVFRGTSAGISANAKLVATGTSEGGSRFGSSLAAGDFDGRTVSGKRIPYLVIGASEWSGGWGKVRIYRRADSGFAFSETQTLDAPSSIASPGAHYGKVLAVGRVDGGSGEALLVGVPDAGAGSLVIYRHTTGSAPLQSVWVANGGASAGDDFGAAIAVGNFIGASGGQNEMVVGASGAGSGAGKLRIGDAQISSGTLWQAWMDQESASPE